MKIELEEPYKSRWKKGYLVINPENRKNILLVNSNTDRTTISYARYLMGVKLGYIVPDGLQVDHIDNDKTNDDPDNLQLLTSKENNLKEKARYQVQDMEVSPVECSWCNKHFFIPERDMNKKLNNKTGIYCSKSCAGKGNLIPNSLYERKGLDTDDINKIKLLKSQGLSSYKISEQTGFARNTVMKYW